MPRGRYYSILLNYGGMLALLGAEKMMYTLPNVWPQGVWGTSRHGPWLTYKGQVSQQRRDGVEVREAHHERRTLPGWTKKEHSVILTLFADAGVFPFFRLGFEQRSVRSGHMFQQVPPPRLVVRAQ